MNFDYEINPNDESIKIVENDESFYNYDKTNLHNFDKSYEELYSDILNDDRIVENYIYPKENFNKKDVLDSILLWKKLGITLHDVNVFKKLRSDNFFVLYNRGVLNSYEMKDPAFLKVDFKNIPQIDSSTRIVEINEKNYKDVAFKKIVVPKVDYRLASTIYAHEMSHVQMVSKDGGTNNIMYEELIPILMEFIFADKIDYSSFTLKYVKNERLMCICNSLNLLAMGNKLSYLNRVTMEKYIISSIYAFKLFEMYYDGSIETRKEILHDINEVFDGNIVVDNMINKYNLDLEDKEKTIKLIKRFDF